MHYHVLGLGPVGCLLAHNLRRTLPSTHRISLIHKTRLKELALLEKGSIQVDTFGAVTTSGGFISEEFQDTNQSPQQQEGNRAQDLKHIQSLFVAVKAQHTVNALKAFTYRLSADSTIVLMQNGMGLYEQLIRDVFRNPSQRPHFILASNTHGAFTTQPFHVIHAGIGSIDFGIAPDSQGRDFEAGFVDETIPHSQRRPRLSDITSPSDVGSTRYRSLRDTVAALLLLEPLNTSWKTYAELELIMRRKLAVNAVLNPLTALMGCRNGELTQLPSASRTIHTICWEASLVYAAEMRRENTLWLENMQSRDIDSKDVTLPSLPKSLTTKCLEEEVVRVAQLTKNNVSSMLQDVRRGKTTEIDYINGYLINLGRELGVRTPVNSVLCDLVKMRQSSPGPDRALTPFVLCYSTSISGLDSICTDSRLDLPQFRVLLLPQEYNCIATTFRGKSSHVISPLGSHVKVAFHVSSLSALIRHCPMTPLYQNKLLCFENQMPTRTFQLGDVRYWIPLLSMTQTEYMRTFAGDITNGLRPKSKQKML